MPYVNVIAQVTTVTWNWLLLGGQALALWEDPGCASISHSHALFHHMDEKYP